MFDAKDSDPLPKWLRDALINNDLTVDLGTSNLSLSIGGDIEGDEVHVHPGDWIMYDLNTELPEEFAGVFVISGNELLEDFEEVPVVRQDAVVQVTGVEATGMTLNP